MRRRSVLIVANPTAGSLKKGRLERFAGILRGLGAQTVVRWTRSAGIAPGGVDLDAAGEVVVAAGGDGTLHQVVNVMRLAGDERPVAFLPLGTANLFGLEAGLPHRDEDLAEMILGAPPREYPVAWGRFAGLSGAVEERVFLLMAGVGWDARVILAVNRRVKSLHGKGAHIVAGLRMLAAGEGEKARLLADGRSAEGEMILAANSPYYGGDFSLAPRADRRRPTLSVAVISRITPARLVALAWHARRREEDPSGNVSYLEAGEIEVTSPGIPIQMDGDPVGSTPALFRKGGWKFPAILGRG